MVDRRGPFNALLDGVSRALVLLPVRPIAAARGKASVGAGRWGASLSGRSSSSAPAKGCASCCSREYSKIARSEACSSGEACSEVSDLRYGF